jgi:hypothetical protein
MVSGQAVRAAAPKRKKLFLKKPLTRKKICGIIRYHRKGENAMTEQKAPRRQSKKDLANALLAKLEEWQKAGDTPDEAIERLTLRQYDFLIDYGVNLDNLILTTAQQNAIKAITKAPRTVKPGGYNKKYPQSKQDLFNALCEFVKAQGGEIQDREKINFRDLDFTIGETAYKIVLSNPRPPKKT